MKEDDDFLLVEGGDTLNHGDGSEDDGNLKDEEDPDSLQIIGRHLRNFELASDKREASKRFRTEPEIREIVQKGLIPASLRSKFWLCCVSETVFTNFGRYQLLCTRMEGHSSVATDDISKDLHRTFPKIELFRSVEGQQALGRILTCYSIHNPQVGYCQSMNFIAALIYLVCRSEEDTFLILTHIVERILPPNYFTNKLSGFHIDACVLESLLQRHIVETRPSLSDLGEIVTLLCLPWFLCLFANSMPHKIVVKIWDNIFYEGSVVLMRVGLAALLNWGDHVDSLMAEGRGRRKEKREADDEEDEDIFIAGPEIVRRIGECTRANAPVIFQTSVTKFSIVTAADVDQQRETQVLVVQQQLEKVRKQREELEAGRRRNAVAVQGVVTGVHAVLLRLKNPSVASLRSGRVVPHERLVRECSHLLEALHDSLQNLADDLKSDDDRAALLQSLTEHDVKNGLSESERLQVLFADGTIFEEESVLKSIVNDLQQQRRFLPARLGHSDVQLLPPPAPYSLAGMFENGLSTLVGTPEVKSVPVSRIQSGFDLLLGDLQLAISTVPSVAYMTEFVEAVGLVPRPSLEQFLPTSIVKHPIDSVTSAFGGLLGFAVGGSNAAQPGPSLASGSVDVSSQASNSELLLLFKGSIVIEKLRQENSAVKFPAILSGAARLIVDNCFQNVTIELQNRIQSRCQIPWQTIARHRDQVIFKWKRNPDHRLLFSAIGAWLRERSESAKSQPTRPSSDEFSQLAQQDSVKGNTPLDLGQLWVLLWHNHEVVRSLALDLPIKSLLALVDALLSQLKETEAEIQQKKTIESILTQLDRITSFSQANPTSFVARECLAQLAIIKRQIWGLPKGLWRDKLDAVAREKGILFSAVASGPDREDSVLL